VRSGEAGLGRRGQDWRSEARSGRERQGEVRAGTAGTETINTPQENASMNDNDPRTELNRQLLEEVADLKRTLLRTRGRLADAKAERDYFKAAHEELVGVYRYLLASPDDYHAVRQVAVQDNLI
jgi:hypothetical protein